MKGLVDELNLDVDDQALDNIVNQVQGDKKDSDKDAKNSKKDEEKKDWTNYYH